MELVVEDLVRRFGGFTAVDGIRLTVPSGSCVALLGPSGCGKTTTLNMIAGFQRPDGGDIRVGGRSVVGIAPHKRSTGMVFQNYALFPHLTTFDNIAYGLRQRKVAKARIAAEVKRALDLVHLAGLDARYPRQLSGGQQQRVALARALIFGPELLLLDEPLSNLDAKLRETMRVELKEIQRRSGVTTVFVTHDQAEAMALADQVAVMNQGRVEQLACPEEVYRRPTTRFVANFVGSANFLSGTLLGRENGYAIVELPRDAGSVRIAAPAILARGDQVEFIVRPERLLVSRTAPAGNALSATVENVTFTGSHVEGHCRFGDTTLQLQFVSGDHALTPGDTVWLGFAPDDAYALPDRPK